MNNFGRAMRLSLRYRGTFAASVICALAVAVLWGGNVGALYPFVAVALEGKSLHEWSDNAIDRSETAVAKLRGELTDIDVQLVEPDADQAALEKQRQKTLTQLGYEERGLARSRWTKEHVVEPYMPRDAFQTVLIVAAALVGMTVLKCVFLIINALLVARMVQLASFNLTKTFYRQTLRMDMAHFTAEGSSDLMSRFTYDMECLSHGMKELFGKFIREPLKMFACLAGAAWISWQLLVLSMLLAPLAAVSINALSKSLKRANRRAMEEMSQIYNTLDETLQGIKVVKAFTMERHERRRFHHNSKAYYQKSMKIARYDSLTRPLVEMLGIATICVALLAGAYLGINQQTHLFGIRMSDRPLTIEPLILFFGFLAGASDPARKLSEVFSRLQRASAAADRVYQLIDRQPTIVDPPQPVALARHHRELVFDHVNFHYQPTQPVLVDIDLRIAFGETIAIVGPNGCGKTTLSSLIARFYDPVAGTVRLDGIDLRDVRLSDLRGQLGLVTQETLLFDDTVYNNIRYGSLWATRQQVIDAAQQAHAHRFIETKLERGYETVVGPRGSMLSGGQRQRIALARAILRNPSLLILDEATSQIDLESEQLIHKVLEQFVRGRTTVIITHRTATLALADRIVVMQAGRILDVGTHDELLGRSELYSRLYSVQFKETA
ncbi:MAG: ABC transporter ATP-binding protein [Planctomycetia bacterium]|nr:ABC transporter ATP-binding protein [Planctomycetia bacterium]